VVVVSLHLAADKKGVSMFSCQYGFGNNWKIWLILHQKNYLIILPFGKKERKNLAEDLGFHSGGIPIVQSIREAGDYGRPAAMQTASAGGEHFRWSHS
jgi:hypothetical protein